MEFRKELDTILFPMEQSGLIDPWHDGEIRTGTDWDETIRTSLEEAQVIILLISRAFNASKYIITNELPSIRDKQLKGEVVIIPILVRSISFAANPVADLQCIPVDEKQRLKAVNEWIPRDKAWTQIDDKIREVVSRFSINKPIDTKELSTTEKTFFKLGDQHQFTCDRVAHQDKFYDEFETQKSKKIQYYYLYGQEVQSHSGLFKRIGYDRQGILQDYLNNNIEASCTVIKREVTFEESGDEDRYKKNVIKSILAAFGLQVNEEEPILEKDIYHLLDKSEELQGLSEKDYVCLLLRISEYDWDSVITPKVVQWLISSFFEKELAANQPNFLIFFGLIYEENDSEIEEEVLASIKEGKYLKILPELEKVTNRDIKKWFSQYKFLFQSVDSRKTYREKFFGDHKALDMETVEIALKRIQDLYNGNKGPL